MYFIVRPTEGASNSTVATGRGVPVALKANTHATVQSRAAGKTFFVFIMGLLYLG